MTAYGNWLCRKIYAKDQRRAVVILSDYDISFLGRRAEELGFIRDTLEKVIRLTDILEYFNTNPLLKENLALKGGTAINLTICSLPRLSVDIDLDYLKTDSREEMLRSREMITFEIDRYMKSQSYTRSPKSKSPLSLDSWVYEYTNPQEIKTTSSLKSTIHSGRTSCHQKIER